MVFRLIVFGLAIAAMAVTVVGCGSDRGSIEVRNDLGRTVELLQCSDNLCTDDFRIRGDMEPGASFQANVSTSGVPNPWLVLEPSGERLGCLPLVMPEPTGGLVARLSDVVPCSGSYDESRFWPPKPG